MTRETYNPPRLPPLKPRIRGRPLNSPKRSAKTSLIGALICKIIKSFNSYLFSQKQVEWKILHPVKQDEVH